MFICLFCKYINIFIYIIYLKKKKMIKIELNKIKYFPQICNILNNNLNNNNDNLNNII